MQTISRHLIAHQPEWRAPSCVWPGPGAAQIGKGGAMLGNAECISLEAGDGALPSGWFGSPRTGHVGGVEWPLGSCGQNRPWLFTVWFLTASKSALASWDCVVCLPLWISVSPASPRHRPTFCDADSLPSRLEGGTQGFLEVEPLHWMVPLCHEPT